MNALPTGKIIGEPIDAYHAADAVSHSKLEVYRRRPELFRRMYVEKSVSREGSTKAFDMGSALHCAVLEPDAFLSRFAVNEHFDDFRSKEAREWKASVQASGRTVLTMSDALTVRLMREAITAHPAAAQLLKGGEAEVSWRMKFPGLPVPLQCRTDYFAGHVVDIKTVETLDDDAFRSFDRAFVSFGYHRQAAWYMTLLADCGVHASEFYFIVVEKAQPHGVAVYRTTQEAVNMGARENERDLLALAASYHQGVWANLSQEIQEIAVPEWYAKKAEAAA